jgi:hypothetical protein
MYFTSTAACSSGIVKSIFDEEPASSGVGSSARVVRYAIFK